MRVPVVSGLIKRRLLVNFRAEPGVVAKILPEPFRPKLHNGYALVGICLIRLEEIRPSGLPALLGVASENAAHRIAIEWEDDGVLRQGVYVPRRDTNSLLNRLAGGRLFPGEQHAADFTVSDEEGHIELSLRSLDGEVTVTIVGNEAETLPVGSCFSSPEEASAFFESGDLGYSPAHGADHLDGLLLHTLNWRASPFSVQEIRSSYFENRDLFPEGSVIFDHALIMRDIPHEWRHAMSMPVGQGFT